MNAEKDLKSLSIDPEARRPRRAGRGPVIGILAAAAVVVAVILVILLRGGGAQVEVAVARTAGAQGTAVLNASGYVTPRRRATISSKITGKIVDVLFDEGMAVTSGQVLARLDDADALAALRAVEAEREVYRSELARLEVELEYARRNLERQRELRARDLNTEQELDDAQTAAASLGVQVESARRRIEAAERSVAISRQNLENCTIRAPFGGIVVSKDAQPGEMVSPISAGGGYTRTGIATIVDMASLEIEVDVNESYIARVAPGQRVEALLDAYPDWRIPSRVRTVIPTADRQKATVKVRISFDSLDPRILPDMGVKVSFLEERPDSTAGAPKALVPKGALRRGNGAAYLFVLREGTLERRAVKAGRELGSEIEIVAGLRGGERVVISGTEALHDGQRVSVRE